MSRAGNILEVTRPEDARAGQLTLDSVGRERSKITDLPAEDTEPAREAKPQGCILHLSLG